MKCLDLKSKMANSRLILRSLNQVRRHINLLLNILNHHLIILIILTHEFKDDYSLIIMVDTKSLVNLSLNMINDQSNQTNTKDNDQD